MFKHIKMQDDKNLLEKGFTLIEILVVVAILGILAAVAIFAVGNLTKDAKKNACAIEAATVETASAAYAATHNGQAALTTAALETEDLLTKTPPYENKTPDGFTYDYDATTKTAKVTPVGACVAS